MFSRKHRFFIILFVVILVFVFLYFQFYINPIFDRIQAHSFVASLHHGLSQLDKIEIKSIFGNFEYEWKLLPESSYEKLSIIFLNKKMIFDGSKLPRELANILQDEWGNLVVIAVRKGQNDTIQFLVTSKGPDGIYGTQDDILSLEYSN